MEYSHLYFFEPKGAKSLNSKTYKIPVSCESKKPDKSSRQRAKRHLSKRIDPYATRNHWSTDRATIECLSPPWKTNSRLLHKLRNMKFVSSVQVSATQKSNTFILKLETKEDKLLEFLKRYYKIKELPLLAESEDSELRLQTRWTF